MGKNTSGMLDSILTAMLKKKKQMEAGMQSFGRSIAADTANKQKLQSQGKYRPGN